MDKPESQTTVTLTPHYVGELSFLQTGVYECSNRRCTPDLATRIMNAAKKYSDEQRGRDFHTATIMTPPRRKKSLVYGYRLETTLSRRCLTLFGCYVRTYGVDHDGEVFVHHTYPEIPEGAFVSLYPLTETTLDASVLEHELLGMLLHRRTEQDVWYGSPLRYK